MVRRTVLTHSLVLSLLVSLGPLGVAAATAQCILANPSFEMPGQSGASFGGWNQFGVVGSTSDADHGGIAARVSGPDLGGWDVSGYWQRLDAEPGEQWEVRVRVAHPSDRPLAGESRAIVNVEWRDSGGALIAYESHAAADATTPSGQYRDFSVASGPAPVGTAAVHLLLGVLQAPDDPAPDVHYDQVTFFSLQSPTMDELQWNDFPGGRTVEFGGRNWRVKGPGYYGPGPNLFSDDVESVWVDDDGRLHLTNRRIGNSWYSTEVALEEALGYGDYVFTTQGPLDQLDPAVVFGLFIWQYGPCYDPGYLWWNPYNEIDVEFSRWGNPARGIGQFVAQPYDHPGNIERFDAVFAVDEITSHAFRWLADRVEFRSWRGGPADETPANAIHTWTYSGPHIPRPEQPRVHLNLWRFDAPPATDQEVVLAGFTFVPAADPTHAGERPGPDPLAAPAARLGAAHPNPFNPGTRIRYTLDVSSRVEIAVYDVAGRRVRTLVDGTRAAGDHETFWNGRDETGSAVASGVYLYRLRSGDVVETRRLSVVR
ncbi:MAG: FlgD immunoglobulin-like domain containing protein [Candidatus Krumholzibacteriia bacterium]